MSSLRTNAVLQGLNTAQVVYLALQLLQGLQMLHRVRIVHRDIAARNCL